MGLSRTDAEVYVHLATKGPETARKISENLSINMRQIYRSLKNLQNKGIVMGNSEFPSEFSALAFEKAVDILLEMKHNQAKSLEESKAVLISDFLSKREKVSSTQQPD